ncbi:MAG: O-methyltransferase [Candidatus Bathyarchaeia archaeon]|jgi:predicted O-methyltransferase YrrM
MEYEEVLGYVQRLVGEDSGLQKWVYGKSQVLREQGVFPIDPTRGRFLELLSRMTSPQNVLEIGSGAGYSALWFMKGMGNKGTLHAIEVNPKVVEVLRNVIEKAGLEGRVEIHHGPALDMLHNMSGPFDLVFIDADKGEYPAYLDHALRLTRTGSTILADNMLWNGATVRGDVGREGVRGIMEYTKRIFGDPRLSSIIVPLGDGVALSYRIR